MKQKVWSLCSNGERFLGEGQHLLAKGQVKEALTKFAAARMAYYQAVESLEREDPNDHDEEAKAYAYAHLGEAQRLLQDDNAIESFHKAIDCAKRVGKSNPYALAHLGEYYRDNAMQNRTNLEHARKHFAKAIGKRSETPYLWAYAHRGAAHDFSAAKPDELKEALADLNKAIENSETPYAWALAYRSVVYMLLMFQEKQDIDKAHGYARHAWKDLLTAMAYDPTVISPYSDVVNLI